MNDPLDEEYKCPSCDGFGGFDEGGTDGVMRGSPDDFITCFNCKGSGSIAPVFHPGKDGEGARGMTVFDIRDEQHREDYDVENAMPFGNKKYVTGENLDRILDPMRQGFRRDGEMKMTRVNIAPPEEIASVDPALRHRMPSVYMRELRGQPSNAGLNITGDPERGGTPLFTMGNPMSIAWRLLKSPEGPWYHGTSRMNQAMQEGLQPKGRVRYPDNIRAPSPGLFFTTDPREARGFARQSKSNPNERPGVVRVQNVEGNPIKMADGRRHIVVRNPIDRDRFQEVMEDGY